MESESLKKNFILRISGLTLTIFLFFYTIYNSDIITAQILFLLLIIFQTIWLVNYFEKIARSNSSIVHQFNIQPKSSKEETLEKSLKSLKELNKQREDDFQYLNNIIQHIGIGIITFGKSGEVQIFNTAARNLLQVNKLRSIDELTEINSSLVDILKRLRTGGRELLGLEINGDVIYYNR